MSNQSPFSYARQLQMSVFVQQSWLVSYEIRLQLKLGHIII